MYTMKIKPADPSEWNSINGDNTLRLNYPELNENSVVVDIGARHGHWANPIREKYNSKVICFEIVEEFVNDLRDQGFTVYDVAVLDNNNIEQFGINDHEASIFHTDNMFKVKTIDTVNLFKLIHSPIIDLLKLNIEGAEYRVIKNLIDNSLVQNVTNIQVQFHQIYEFEKHYEKLYDLLQNTHELSWRYPFIWENWKLK